MKNLGEARYKLGGPALSTDLPPHPLGPTPIPPPMSPSALTLIQLQHNTQVWFF